MRQQSSSCTARGPSTDNDYIILKVLHLILLFALSRLNQRDVIVTLPLLPQHRGLLGHPLTRCAVNDATSHASFVPADHIRLRLHPDAPKTREAEQARPFAGAACQAMPASPMKT
jgi:hypothetical protein